MSDSIREPRSSKKAVYPQPLPLTRAEAETLRTAVQRIIQASESVAPMPGSGPKKKPRRR